MAGGKLIFHWLVTDVDTKGPQPRVCVWAGVRGEVMSHESQSAFLV